MRLEGREAIEYASQHGGLTLSKYTDPIEDARDGLTVEEAREVAREDPKLIYVDADIDAGADSAEIGAACTCSDTDQPWAGDDDCPIHGVYEEEEETPRCDSCGETKDIGQMTECPDDAGRIGYVSNAPRTERGSYTALARLCRDGAAGGKG